MEYKDYYKTLSVERKATPDQIKQSYRKLARKYHPDISKEPNAEERFKEVQEAYEVLKDPKKRQAYDELGANWQNGQDFRPPPGWQQRGGFQGDAFTEENLGDFSDFFSSIFGGGGFHNQTRGRQQRGSVKHRGRDEHAKIAISLEEAYQGGQKNLQLQVPEVDHHGQVQMKTRTLKLNIPAGVVSGQQLRLANQGGPGAPAGDLFLEIEIQPHRFYTLQGKDIYLTLPIAPWEAALGAKIPVPTLGGAVEMKIAPGSQAGQKLRLKGRGLPAKPEAGDQYVLLQIVTPPAKTEADKALYGKMAEQMQFNPRVFA